MNKYLIATLGLALAGACTSSFAQDTGAFFINAGVGQAQLHVGRTDGPGYNVDDKDIAGALRFGYAWRASNLEFGIEAGYVDLGKVVSSYHWTSDDGYDYEDVHAEAAASGWLAGVNGKYHLGSKWFVSARAGEFRSTVDASYSYSAYHYTEDASGSADGNGWYGGVGAGYDFTPNFGLSLSYDNYHVKAKTDAGSVDGNVGSYMLSAEYRF